MTDQTGGMTADLPCHICGYDLRAHPEDGKCPECGASVAEARRLAAIPLRPAWRDSDPRWRRRMLAGAWILVLLPLMDVLKGFEWTSRIPVPTVFDYRGTVRTLNDTLVCLPTVYPPIVFCIGVVLLFSKERGRRPARLDWTRRWGILCSYVVLLLSATGALFIMSLVAVGIAALLLSISLKYQPEGTQLFVDVSSTYLRYGPHPMTAAVIVLVVFSSITILLACIPLFEALRSTRVKRLGAMLLAPLAFFALLHLWHVARYCLHLSTSDDVFHYGIYFWPGSLVSYIADRPLGLNVEFTAVLAEWVKWSIVLTIAVWLSLAQVVAWRQSKRTMPQSSPN